MLPHACLLFRWTNWWVPYCLLVPDFILYRSHKKKRAKQIKKLMQRGLMDPEKADPFSLFLETSDITYCLYRDSERVLGNHVRHVHTAGLASSFCFLASGVVILVCLLNFLLLMLQDFEALTPNLLARTIETVEGGGLNHPASPLTVLAYQPLYNGHVGSSCEQDVHERFRTESHTQAAARFNERFLLSIASCKACVVMDDELNILPISSHMKFIPPVTNNEDSEGLSKRERELKDIKDQLREDFPVGPLIAKCCTLDQGINALEYKVLSLPETTMIMESFHKLNFLLLMKLLPFHCQLLSPCLVHTLFSCLPLSMGMSVFQLLVMWYEGTGRSLSLKLLQQLESQSHSSAQSNGSNSSKEFLFILRLPHPKECDLYYVNRDTLFSYHKESEIFLQYGNIIVLYLISYYEGQMTLFADDDEETEEPEVKITEAVEKASLLEENIKPRANLPPLLVHLRERRPEKLHYLGVSFGLTQELFRFWRKHNFYPFYVGQISVMISNLTCHSRLTSAVTGEHTCMVLKPLNSDDIEVSESNKCGFLDPFYQDFRQRFRRLLGTSFRHLNFKLAMSVLASKIDYSNHEPSDYDSNASSKLLRDVLSPHDMKRLEAYSNNLVDYHLILDLVPILAHQYFSEKLPVSLHGAQAAVLFCMGLQDKDVDAVKIEMLPLNKSMDEDLAEAAKEVEVRIHIVIY
ncbi:hypothetical protein HU200_026352 [Digitaria exilis]|uniref:Uncharacterized protein n=1 Tax=Digitaria exilis TaxID=1010633 RepID=A0A835BZ11_9POAL|nr:hypothetical protein HU200_026352 [Digitaria exilis]